MPDPLRPATVVALCVATLGCSASDSTGALGGAAGSASLWCGLDDRYLANPFPRDGIPSIDDPRWIAADDTTEPASLGDVDGVVGLTVDGRHYAVPLNFLWYHEIVNATFATESGDVDLAITHCPLTGTSMVFDRAPIRGAALGVSGLLYQSNLVMYDRGTGESFWPQMLGAARCGPADGTVLALHPSIEMTWEGWLRLHPETEVLARPTAGSYGTNPYAGYDRPDAEYTFPMPPLDTRLAPKARVLGVAAPGGPSWVFPFEALEEFGAYGALDRSFGPAAPQAVVLWDREGAAAGAYHRQVGADVLSFRTDADGVYDVETGTRWGVDGTALDGPLVGKRLDVVDRSYVGYWGAWAAFFTLPRIWGRHGAQAR